MVTILKGNLKKFVRSIRTLFPTPIGTIFESNDFSSATDYPIIGGSNITRSGSLLVFNGNPSIWTQYVYRDTGVHAPTTLEKWKQSVRIKTSDTINTLSYGIAIGVYSTNSWQEYSTYVRWSQESNSFGGKMYFYTKRTNNNQIISTGDLFIPSASTYYWMDVERNKNAITASVYSDDRSTLHLSKSTALSLTTGSVVQSHNTSKFSITIGGGTNIHVTHWSASSEENKNVDVMFIGDSNTVGLFAGSNPARWAENAATELGLSYVVYAGISNRTTEVSSSLNEIIELNPKKVVLSIGRNDVASGISLAQTTGSINTIISTLENAGITVLLGGVIASNVDVSAVQTHYSSLPNTQVNFYTATKGATTTLTSSYDSGDGIHLNATGHEALSTLIKTIL
jgi:lysophospholipase L1-like esterase